MEPGELVGVPKHGKKDELMQLGTERGRDERVQIFYLLALECLYASTGVLFLVASQNSGHRTVFWALSSPSSKLSRAILPRRTSPALDHQESLTNRGITIGHLGSKRDTCIRDHRFRVCLIII